MADIPASVESPQLSAADSQNTSSELDLPVVRLKKRRSMPFFNRHPWVFAGAIHSIDGQPEVGDEVLVESFEHEAIARGLFNPASNIRVRLYSWDLSESCDAELFGTRISQAIQLRRRLFLFPTGEESPNQAVRYVNSEGDGISGLTVDGYGPWLCLQITSAALGTKLPDIVEQLVEELSPQGILLRTEKGIRDAEGMEVDEETIFGSEPPERIVVLENAIQYQVDLRAGQKTGFYCDQRDNRRRAAGYFCEGRILDVCSYSGGFGLNAVIHGNASHVEAIDSSQAALDLAAANAELNGVDDQFTFEKQTAADALQKRLEAGERYEGIVLDPPKMARNRGGLSRAMKGYSKLNRLAVSLLKPGGILVTCSCSGLVTRDLFEEMLADVATQTGRAIQILETRGAAADHPISLSCRESEYLKCYICSVS